MTHLLFLSSLITVLWLCLRCLLTLEFRKCSCLCPTSPASKSVVEHLENLERWSTTSLPHYPPIINSRKCEVCHAKKQGAIWYSWGVILFQMSPPVLPWQNAVLLNPRPPADLNWRLITHFRCVRSEDGRVRTGAQGHLCIKVRDCNLAGIFFSRAKPHWPLMSRDAESPIGHRWPCAQIPDSRECLSVFPVTVKR